MFNAKRTFFCMFGDLNWPKTKKKHFKNFIYLYFIGFFAIFLMCQTAMAMAMAMTMANNNEYNEIKCPKRCMEKYNPICGKNSDGEMMMFVNTCYMSMENCNKSENKSKSILQTKKSENKIKIFFFLNLLF